MSNALPLQRLVKVGVNLSPEAAQIQDIHTIVIAGISDVIDTTERKRLYSDLSSIAAAFGTTSEEYLSALLAFSQTPQISNIVIAKWANVATSGRITGRILADSEQLIATWQAITDPKIKISINGGTATDLTIGSFAAVANLNGVAALVQTAVAGLVAGSTCAWDASEERFVIKSGTTGILSSVSFLTAPATGTDITGMLGMTAASSGAYLTTGVAAETAVEMAADLDNRFGQEWYALIIPSANEDDHQAVASFIESTTNKHTYWVNSTDSAILSSVSVDDMAAVLKSMNLNRTILQFSSNSSYAVSSLAAKSLSVDYNGNNTVIDLMYKQEPTLIAETMNSNQASILVSKNANAFLAYNNDTAIIEPGNNVDGIPIDIITGTDWLALTIQTAVYNKLYTNPTKIPQTDSGNHEIKTVIESVLSIAVSNGLLAPGVWSSAGFGALKSGDFLPSGYYVYAPPISQQLQADREARKSVLFQIAAKLAGSIRYVDILINVNR